jgi:hypothetical protein
MSDKPQLLTKWDFPDTKEVPDGYHIKEELVASDDNFKKLVEEHNKLVEWVTGKTG